MIDIIYLAYNRLEFTRKSAGSLLANTDWSQVRRVLFYDDGSTDGTLEYLSDLKCPVPSEIVQTRCGSPVAIMNHFLDRKDPSPIFAKIDNDVMLPVGWLEASSELMDGIDLLGIEAMFPVGDGPRTAQTARYIGGIGLMRAEAFHTRPEPQGRFGFTAWQDMHENIRKAWIDPALPVCLLDRMPSEPWRTLSDQYVAAGWQRPWGKYTASQSALWEWWDGRPE